MMKRLFAVLLALAMLLSVSAVFAESEETAAEPAAETVPVPDTLLVTVAAYQPDVCDELCPGRNYAEPESC